MKINKKTAWVMLLILLCTIVSAQMVNPMRIRRGGAEECIQIWDDTTVVQNIKLCNTTVIHWGVLREGQAEIGHCDAQLIVRMEQDGVSDAVNIRLDGLEARWQTITLDFDFSKFQNGDAYITITGKNMDVNYPLTILLTSGEQILQLDHVIVNGEVKEGMYIPFTYGFFSWEIFCVFLAIFTLLTTIVFWTGPYVKRFCIKYPAPFLYLVILAVRYIQDNVAVKGLDGWMTAPYLVNYKHGFVSKALPGTIYALFSDYVTSENLQIVFHVIFFIFSFLVFGIMVFWIRNAETQAVKNVLNIIFLYYTVCPYSVTFYYWQWGRMEIILSILFLISGCLLLSKQWKWTYLIAFLSSCAVLTHQIYIFTLYPAVFGMFVYRMIVKKEKRYLGPFCANIIIPGILGFYVQFIGKISMPFQEYVQYLREHTDMEVNDTMISGEYYIPTGENAYTFGVLDSKASFGQVCLVFSLILLFPIIRIFLQYWKKCIKKQISVWDKRITFMTFSIVPLASMAMFLTISDYGRIVNLVVCAILFLTVFLIKLDRAVFESSALEVYDEMNKKYGKWHVLLISCYLLVLGRAVVGTNLQTVVYPIANLMDRLSEFLLN